MASPSTVASQFSHATKHSAARAYPDTLDSGEIPPLWRVWINGRRSPLYALGWILRKKEWYSVVKSPPELEGKYRPNNLTAIRRRWRELYFEEFGRTFLPCRFTLVAGYSMYAIVYNDTKDLRYLENDETLLKKIIDRGATAMGLTKEMASQVKWYNLDSLCNGRSTVWHELDADPEGVEFLRDFHS